MCIAGIYIEIVYQTSTMLYDLGKNTINDMQKEGGITDSDFPLRKMLELLPDGVSYYQAVREKDDQLVDFRLQYYNQQFIGLLTPAYRLLIGTYMLKDNPEQHDFLSPLVDQFRRVVETGEQTEYAFFDPSLKIFVTLRINKLEDGVFVTVRESDKTRLLQTEKQATTLWNVLDSSINGIMSYKSIRNTANQIIDFELQSVNRAAEEILRQRAEEIVGKTLLELYPEEVELGLFDQYCRTVETGLSFRQQVCYKNAESDRWLDLACNRLDDGIVVSFANVTAVRQAQEVIRNQANLFTTMSQSIPDLGVLVCDANYRILFANGDLPDIFLLNKSELIGKRLAEVMSVEMASYTEQNFGDALAGRSRYMNEEIANQYYEVFVGPVSDSEGRTIMAVATLRNITSMKRAHQQLEQSVQELKRSNQNLEQFAYIASHDLQEPLRKIQSFGDVLRDQYETQLGEQGGDLIRRMQMAATRMSVLIRDLLTYSRVASYKEAFQPVDLNQIMAEVLDDLETIIQEKQAIIQVDKLPTIQGSPLQLRQLFQNLLSNSLKFNRVNVVPEVTIKVTHHPKNELPVSADRTRLVTGVTEITIQDNGIGFEPDQADRIFQVFQRLHGRSEFSGTGIGLAIVQKVIENHRGFIRATAEPGSGATFTLIVPL